MLPNTLIARRYFTRGASLWLLTRALASVAILFGEGDPLQLTLTSSVLMVGASIVLGAADMNRRHERALLENLAVSRAMRVAFFAVPALLGEIIISVVVSLAG